MGYMNTILAAVLCATAPIASVQPAEIKQEQNQTNLRLGKDFVASVRAAYNNGEYDTFLKEMDASYKDADLSGLIEMRQEAKLPEKYLSQEQQFFDLQKQKNKDLLAVLSDKDSSIFAQKVRSVAGEIYTPEQEKAIARFATYYIKAPNTGANSDENTLIDLDLEYQYKLLHIYMPAASTEHRLEYALALRMEKMDRMVAAAKNFQDLDLKKAVGIASSNFDAKLARNLDGDDLYKMVKAKVKPNNAVEEQVYSILASYQAQFSDLLKQMENEVK